VPSQEDACLLFVACLLLALGSPSDLRSRSLRPHDGVRRRAAHHGRRSTPIETPHSSSRTTIHSSRPGGELRPAARAST